jgi:hypothetical protein
MATTTARKTKPAFKQNHGQIGPRHLAALVHSLFRSHFTAVAAE